MTKLTMTRHLAWCAAQDAGCRSMRKAGRTAWNMDDYNEAIRRGYGPGAWRWNEVE